jgi:IclR family transcriptional regulator, KDG regulon repressor
MSLTSADVEPGRALVGSVLRALRLLDLFERGRPEMSLAEFVRRSGYSKSTAYRLLVTLEKAGWLGCCLATTLGLSPARCRS